MSLPNIPNIKPEISITTKEAVDMLLSSVAMEGIGLSHIINAEGEKIQHILGTLESDRRCKNNKIADIEDILLVNKSVSSTLNGILKNQLMLQLKLENAMELFDKINHECKELEYLDEYFDECFDDFCNEYDKDILDDNYINCHPSYME